VLALWVTRVQILTLLLLLLLLTGTEVQILTLLLLLLAGKRQLLIIATGEQVT
jgi:hypothetical protein